MQVTFTAKSYRPESIRKRYVHAVPGTKAYYAWSEVGDDRRYDLRQGTCTPAELAPAIRAAADKLRDTWPNGVEWPIA